MSSPWPQPGPDQDRCRIGRRPSANCCCSAAPTAGNVQRYPRLFCTACRSRQLAWQPASGRGRIYSCTVVRRAPTPALRREARYVVAVVELDEGPRVMGNVVGTPVEEVNIGAPVVVEFRDQGEQAVPVFRVDRLPTGAPSAD